MIASKRTAGDVRMAGQEAKAASATSTTRAKAESRISTFDSQHLGGLQGEEEVNEQGKLLHDANSISVSDYPVGTDPEHLSKFVAKIPEFVPAAVQHTPKAYRKDVRMVGQQAKAAPATRAKAESQISTFNSQHLGDLQGEKEGRGKLLDDENSEGQRISVFNHPVGTDPE